MSGAFTRKSGFARWRRSIQHPNEIAPTLRKSSIHEGSVLIGVHFDYQDNFKLFEGVHEPAMGAAIGQVLVVLRGLNEADARLCGS
jgi:hypothetical protein